MSRQDSEAALLGKVEKTIDSVEEVRSLLKQLCGLNVEDWEKSNIGKTFRGLIRGLNDQRSMLVKPEGERLYKFEQIKFHIRESQELFEMVSSKNFAGPIGADQIRDLNPYGHDFLLKSAVVP